MNKKTTQSTRKKLLLLMLSMTLELCTQEVMREIELHGDGLAVLEVSGTDDSIMRDFLKYKRYARLTVLGPADVDSLYVIGDAIIGGSLRVQDQFVNGDTVLNNLTAARASVLESLAVAGSLTVCDVPFGSVFLQAGNSWGTPAILGTNDAQHLYFETNNIQRVQISSTGSVVISAPTAGTALTVNAGASAVGLVVQGNGLARAAIITAGNGTGGGLQIKSGIGAGIPLEVNASVGQGSAAEFVGNNNAATAITITPGVNRVGLTIQDSGTAPGLKVFDSAQVNTSNQYPLFVGGTEVNPGAFVPAFGQTNTPHIGTPRMIWAHISDDSMAVSQSGGLITVGHTSAGVYPITYDSFGSVAPIVLVTTQPGFVAYASNPSATGATIMTATEVLGVLTPTDADFNLLIIGLAT